MYGWWLNVWIYTTIQKFGVKMGFFSKELKTFIYQRCSTLIKTDSKDF